MTEIQRKFQAYNPRLVYIDHKYLDGGRVGVSFIAISGSNVLGGVKIYKTRNGEIDWQNPIGIVDSWDNIKQKER